jgi:homoserine O-succinyltransferase
VAVSQLTPYHFEPAFFIIQLSQLCLSKCHSTYPLFLAGLQTQAILDEHKDRVIAALENGEAIPAFPEPLVTSRLHNTWHDTAEAVIDNWIGKVYQVTSMDRKQPFMEGIDPEDPLGLRR